MAEDSTIINNMTLRRVFYGGNRSMTTEIEKIHLPSIRNFLDRYLDRIQQQPCEVPLSISSQVIVGAANLYKTEASSLLQECYELDMEMAVRKTRMVKFDTSKNESSNVKNGTLSSSSRSVSNQDYIEEETEGEGFYGEHNNDSSSSTRKRGQSTPNHVHREKRSCLDSTDSSNEMNQSFGAVFNRDNSDEANELTMELSLPMSESTQTHDKSIQTNKSFIRQNINKKKGTCTENNPFGFMMIFDNYSDRLPSKILYCNLNSRVKDL